MHIRTVVTASLILILAIVATNRESTGEVVKLDTPATRPAAAGDAFVLAASDAGSMADVFPGIQKLLKGTVDGLPAKAKFDVVLFNAAGQTKSSDAPATANAAGKAAAGKFIDNAAASGDGDPAAGITSAMDLHPAQVFLILDAVPDPDAFTKAVDAADPKNKVKLNVIFLTDTDTKETKAAITALKAAVKSRHGTVKVIKRAAMKE